MKPWIFDRITGDDRAENAAWPTVDAEPEAETSPAPVPEPIPTEPPPQAPTGNRFTQKVGAPPAPETRVPPLYPDIASSMHLALPPEIEVEELMPPAPTGEDDPVPEGHLTVGQVREAMPLHLRNSVTRSMVDRINTVTKDPIAAEAIRDNFIGLTTVLKEGKFKVQDYLNAVTYVSYRLSGLNNTESYAKTFPERYQELIQGNVAQKVISTYVSSYNANKLVNLLMEQTTIEPWVANQDLYYKALNRSVWLMENASSELVQQQASKAVMEQLRKPAPVKGSLKLELAENSGMKELTSLLDQVARTTVEGIRRGEMKTIDVAAQRIAPSREADDV